MCAIKLKGHANPKPLLTWYSENSYSTVTGAHKLTVTNHKHDLTCRYYCSKSIFNCLRLHSWLAFWSWHIVKNSHRNERKHSSVFSRLQCLNESRTPSTLLKSWNRGSATETELKGRRNRWSWLFILIWSRQNDVTQCGKYFQVNHRVWGIRVMTVVRALKRMGGETSACLLCDAWCGVRLGRERSTRKKSKMAAKSGVGDKQLILSLDEDLSDESREVSHWWKKPKLPR